MPRSYIAKIWIQLVWDNTWALAFLKDSQVILMSIWAENHCVLVCTLGCRHSLIHPSSIHTFQTLVIQESLGISEKGSGLTEKRRGRGGNVKLPTGKRQKQGALAHPYSLGRTPALPPGLCPQRSRPGSELLAHLALPQKRQDDRSGAKFLVSQTFLLQHQQEVACHPPRQGHEKSCCRGREAAS